MTLEEFEKKLRENSTNYQNSKAYQIEKSGKSVSQALSMNNQNNANNNIGAVMYNNGYKNTNALNLPVSTSVNKSLGIVPIKKTNSSNNVLENIANKLAIATGAEKPDTQVLKGARNTTKNFVKNLGQNAKNWEDGYQFGDVSKTILGSTADAGLNAYNAVAKMMEGFSNLSGAGIAQGADWLGYNKFANAMRKEISNPNSDALLTPKVNAFREKYVEPYSILGSSADQIASGFGSTIGASALSVLGGANIGKLHDIPVGMGIAEMGNSVAENYSKEDVTDAQAWLNGAGKGIVSALSESIFGLFGVGGSELEDAIVKGVTKNMESQLAKGMTQLGIKAGGEASEEFLEYAGNYLVNLATDYASRGKGAEFFEAWNNDEVLQNMLSAFISTGITQGGSSIQNIARGTDVITGNTKATQEQIDQEVNTQKQALEQEGKKVGIPKLLELEQQATEKVYLQQGKASTSIKVVENENLTDNEKDMFLNMVESSKNLNELNGINRLMNLDYKDKTGNVTQEQVQKITENYLASAKANNIDVNNVTVQSMLEIATARGFEITYDKNAFNNSNEGAKWTVDDNGNRKVFINPNVNNETSLQNLTVHELTHDLENTEDYKVLSDLVLDFAEKRGFKNSEAETDLRELYKDELAKYDTKEKQNAFINSELVANILGTQLGNQEFINHLTISNRQTANKLYNWVVDKLNRLNRLTGYKFEKLYWADVKNKFDKAFKADFNNYNGESKFKKVNSKEYGTYWYVEESKDLFKGINNKKELMSTVYKYILKGNKNFEIIHDKLSDRKIDFIRISAQEYLYGENSKKLNSINYQEKMRLAPSIDDLISNASITYSSPLTHENKLFKEGFNNYQGKVKIDNTIFTYIVRVGKTKSNSIFYDISLEPINNKKGAEVKVPSIKNTSPIKNSAPINKSISQNAEKVNYVNTDNKGRQLTQEQQEYFKDSKVRDKNGKLLEVYHGTPYNFNTFNYEKLGENTSSLGAGFYFTDVEQTGNEYTRGSGELKKVYLDIQKPMTYGKTTMTKNEYQKFVEAVNQEVEGRYFEDYGGIEDALKEYDYGGDDIDLVNAVHNASGLTWDKTFEILRNSTGYDGIISEKGFVNKDETIYVAFNANQIKNVDNTTPTSNPDTRYSKQSTGAFNEWLDKNTSNKETKVPIKKVVDNEGRQLTKQQQEYFKDSKVRNEKGELTTVYHTTTDKTTQFNEFNPVGTPYYRFGDQIVNYYTDSRDMSGSYANNKYEIADTTRISDINDAKKWISDYNSKSKETWKISYDVEENDGKVELLQYEINSDGKKSKIGTYETTFKRLIQDTQLLDHNFYNKQYQGYANITNPYIIDAEGRNWDRVVEKLNNDTEKEINDIIDSEKIYDLIDLQLESEKKCEEYNNSGKKAEYDVIEDLVKDFGRGKSKELKSILEDTFWFGFDYDEYIKEFKNGGVDVQAPSGDTKIKDILNEYFESHDPNDIRNRDKKIDKYGEMTLKEFLKTANEAFQENILYKNKDSYFLEKYHNILGESKVSITGEKLYRLADNAFSRSAVLDILGERKTTNDIVNQVIEMNKNGANYDGIIMKNVVDYGGDSRTRNPANIYVTFNSNQFKAVDNTTPTSDSDIRYSKQSNGEFSNWVDKNTNNTGTQTKVSDVLLPENIRNIKDEIREKINTTGDLDTELKKDLRKLVDNTNDEKQLKKYLDDINELNEASNSKEKTFVPIKGTIKINNYKNAKINQKIVDTALDMVKPNRQGNRTKDQWLQVAEQIGMNIKESDIDTYANKTWIDLKPNQKENLNRQGEKFVKFTKEEWTQAIRDGYNKNNTSNKVNVPVAPTINNVLKNSTAEAQSMLQGKDISVKQGRTKSTIISNDSSVEVSRSGNIYLDGIKPTTNDFNKVGLENHFEIGDKRLVPNDSNNIEKGYKVEEWVGNQWMSEDNPKLEETKQKNQPKTIDLVSEDSPTMHFLEETRAKKGANVKQILNAFKQKFINSGQYVDILAKQVNNPELKYANDKRLSTFGEAQYSIGIAQTDNQGNEIGKSIKEIFKPAETAGLKKEFNDYLLNRINVERQAVEKSVFGDEITNEQSREIIKQYEESHPEFKEWAEDVYTYNRNELQNMVDAGLISKDLQQLFQDLYGDYVPVHRVLTETAEKAYATNKETGVTSPVKRAKGGNQQILDVETAMAENVLATKKAIRMNELGIQLAISTGHQNILEDIGYEPKWTPDAISSLNGDVVMVEEGKYLYTIFTNGEMKQFQLTKELYESLRKDTLQNKINNSEVAQAVLTPLEKMTKVQRDLLTTYSVGFMLNNPIKDFQDGLFYTKYSTGTFLKNYTVALQEIAKKGDYYKKYMAMGGLDNSYFDYQKGITSEAKGFKKVLNKIQQINGVLETAPRLAEFISSLEHGASVNEAMYNASDITTNFKRGGEYTKVINKYGANFLNASVQGLDKFVRTFTEVNNVKDGVKLVARVASLGVLPALLNGLLYKDDDDYEELEDYIKDEYYLLKLNDEGDFLRIPKGRVMATISSATRTIIEGAKGDLDVKGFLTEAEKQLAPNNPLTDNVLAPIFQVKNNKTWYGSDLVPSRLQNQLPKNQFNEKTDKISLWLGENLNISPIKINYLIDQYSGGFGDVILPMLTPQAENNIITDKFTTSAVMKNKNVGEFYDALDKYEKLNNDSKATEEEKLKYTYLSKISSKIGKLYSQKREIQMDSSITDKEKKELVKDIQREINAYTKCANDLINGEYNTESKWNMYVDGILSDTIRESDGSSALQDALYIVNNGLATKKEYMETYEKYKAQNSSVPTMKTLTKLKDNKVKLTNYAQYDLATKKYESDKDSSGNTISNSLTTKKANYIYTMNISDTQKNALLSTLVDQDYNPNVEDMKKLNGDYLTYFQQSGKSSNGKISAREKYMSFVNAEIPVSQLNKYYNEIGKIEGVKDANGKTISGSKKQAVFNYINSLSLNVGQKKLLLSTLYDSYKKEYYNDVFNYVNSLKMTKEEKQKILNDIYN